jgi:hypothetical protein
VLHVLAVLAAEKKTLWDPTILGVLTVLSGVVLFCGSVYLLLATNVGARLGFLLAASALTGILVLLSTLWLTTSTPLNSPKGRISQWLPIKCPSGQTTCADVVRLQDAPIPGFVKLANSETQQQAALIPVSSYSQLRPGFEAALVTKAATPGVTPPKQPYAKYDVSTGVLTQVFDYAGTAKDLESQAADARAKGDTATAAKLEAQAALYREKAANPATRQLHSYEFGGGTKLLFWHYPRYAAVEYCPSVPASTDPNAKPNPQGLFCDSAAGTRWFLMVYDYGSIRLPPLMYLLLSLTLFLLTLWLLHTRELQQRRDARAAAGATDGAIRPATA